ncbi:putative carboxylesterase 13 [Apium graveolens]|uniref:putative carboxylesterase 13 n=1 Tax=Apium graveolens TaxID=4045 RepID=UPI003D7BFA1A
MTLQIATELERETSLFHLNPKSAPVSSYPTRKLPVLIYVHGGAFSIGSAFSEFYTNYVSSLVASSNVIAVSADYRLAPENPIPACYDDSWEVFKWVASHGSGSGSDPWLTNDADFNRVFVAGDSAGANIGHDIVSRVGSDQDGVGMEISGLVLVHILAVMR